MCDVQPVSTLDSKHIGPISGVPSTASRPIAFPPSSVRPLFSPFHLQTREFDPSEPAHHFTSLTAHDAGALWAVRLNHGLLGPPINIHPGTQSPADPLPVRASLPLSCLYKPPTPTPSGSLLTLCKQNDVSSGIPALTRPISRAACLPNTLNLRWWLISAARCRGFERKESSPPPLPVLPLPSLHIPSQSLRYLKLPTGGNMRRPSPRVQCVSQCARAGVQCRQSELQRSLHRHGSACALCVHVLLLLMLFVRVCDALGKHAGQVRWSLMPGQESQTYLDLRATSCVVSDRKGKQFATLDCENKPSQFCIMIIIINDLREDADHVNEFSIIINNHLTRLDGI